MLGLTTSIKEKLKFKHTLSLSMAIYNKIHKHNNFPPANKENKK